MNKESPKIFLTNNFSMPKQVTSDTAEVIAIKALTFLARDEIAFATFLEFCGATPATLKSLMGDRFFLAGILEFLLAEESLLLKFCAAEKIDPFLPAIAQAQLSGSITDESFI
jgi:hypothetical protein